MPHCHFSPQGPPPSPGNPGLVAERPCRCSAPSRIVPWAPLPAIQNLPAAPLPLHPRRQGARQESPTCYSPRHLPSTFLPPGSAKLASAAQTPLATASKRAGAVVLNVIALNAIVTTAALYILCSAHLEQQHRNLPNLHPHMRTRAGASLASVGASVLRFAPTVIEWVILPCRCRGPSGHLPLRRSSPAQLQHDAHGC